MSDNAGFYSLHDGRLTRRLRVYAVDPSLASRVDTSSIDEVVIDVPWEGSKDQISSLLPGPIGEYIEVVDFDPASDVFYVPVDLDDGRILARDGLPASESDPQFHQQMVYAVAMATIQRFIKAFGRPIFWSDHVVANGDYVEQFVRRLRIYPHALRAKNAYYSPSKKALLFGYFVTTEKGGDNAPGTIVFTCLSHDVIAHEITHALLDGVHPKFGEPSTPDVHAFHEAFADIVALFQRFTYEGVLEREISKSKGDLSSETMLSQLAGQFGRATGSGTALRDALGFTDPKSGKWIRSQPDPSRLDSATAAHERGSILVAAVFDAFLLMYDEQVADLRRISTQGTGVLPEGDIHPDLAHRLAHTARITADRVLSMCIRAIDYCPPVNLTFGDYLRAIITADLDVNPEDRLEYRVAFLQSFKAWGIYPRGLKSMSTESLVWPEFSEASSRAYADKQNLEYYAMSLKEHGKDAQEFARNSLNDYLQSSDSTYNKDKRKHGVLKSDRASKGEEFAACDTRQDRFALWKQMAKIRYLIWRWLNQENERQIVDALGIVIDDKEAKPTVYRNKRNAPAIEVHTVRPIALKTDDFGAQDYWVVEVLQRRRGYLDPEVQKKMDARKKVDKDEEGDFIYRAGCTFFINPTTKEIRWVIKTAGTVNDDRQLDVMRCYLRGEEKEPGNEFAIRNPGAMGLAGSSERDEPFALLHEHAED